MSAVRQQLALETSSAALFREPPAIRFQPERRQCQCGGPLRVRKTRRKKVLTLAGPLVAHETLSYCPECGAVYGSEALRAMVPPRSTVAYDVLVFVGRALFQRHRTTEETLAELAGRHVRDPTRRDAVPAQARRRRETGPRRDVPPHGVTD